MMRVPFLDLTAQYRAIRHEIEPAITKTLEEATFVLGPNVTDFEDAFADYIGAAHCVGVNSGTSALHLALLGLGVGPGDEVVTTPHTWISTTWAVSYCGAVPVFADVDPVTGNLDPKATERAIGPRTKAIIPVDLYGNPADLMQFEALADRHELALIDDAAQAHGAVLGGRRVGTFGRATCFSFYPGKNLGAAGEGGAIVTNDSELASRLRRLRDHAQRGRHSHVEIGYNYRMEGIQGAVLDVKLRHLDRWNDARRGLAERYEDLLSEVPSVITPQTTTGASSAWHLYAVRLRDRDRVAARLADVGVSTGVHYPTPIHLQPAYRFLGKQVGDYPIAERWASECLSLPLYPELTHGQQDFVVAQLIEAIG